MPWRLLAMFLLGCAPKLTTVPTHAPVHGLANIQRTMRLLSEGKPVRILFYGQSITQSAWSRHVATTLRAKYPHTEIRNRALGGFSSERLLETADSDLYPWQPDLVIFHVYGAHDKYEQLIERIRARTSAEVLLQTDHVVEAKDLDEPLDCCSNPPDAAHWSGFMNQAFLPSLVARHQVALCDLRTSWKAHLRSQHLPASALLSDAIHLNALGDQKMAELVEGCLVRDPALISPAEDWVETFPPTNRLVFRGTRVDVVLAAGSGVTRVRIDGVAPSSLGLATFARAHVVGADKWPPIHALESPGPLFPGRFLFTMQRDGARYRFTVDGQEGTTDSTFRSPQLVIDPGDWDIDYAFQMMERPTPDKFEIELRAEPHTIDSFAATAQEHTLTLAQGLSPGPHILELEGDAPVRALNVYRSAADAP